MFWKIAAGAPIKTRMRSWFENLSEDPFVCHLCNTQPETMEHLFLHCPFAQILWLEAYWSLNTNVFHGLSAAQCLRILIHPSRELLLENSMKETLFYK